MLTEAQNARVEELLSQMTLDEKIGQMNQESPRLWVVLMSPFRS